ncbi:hypothetical protein D3C81_1451510 [compost metagenome]
MAIGIWPQPNPARKNACLAPRSASRQICGEKTPNVVPSVSVVRSVSTNCTWSFKSRGRMSPLQDANGCDGAATVTMGTSNSFSASNNSGTAGMEPLIPSRHACPSTGCMTAPRAST